jgi:cobalt-zinc-cadmium efflux system protein
MHGSSHSSHACSHDHAHNHGSGHSHVPPSGFTRAFKIAIAINFLYVLIQVFFAVRSNSNSLFADAAHNLGDVLGLIFAYISLILHEKAATKKYSYGFKKTTILAAITNALILVFTCGFIGYDALIKVLHPDHVAEIDVMIVAACGILLNGGSALLFMKDSQDLNIKGAFLHLAYDALISFGVVVGALVIYYTHWLWLDPLIGVVIVLLVLLGTLSLLRRSIRLVMDGVPPGIDPEQIRLHLLEYPQVVEVHDLHVWAMSTQENILTAHVLVNSTSLNTKQPDQIDLSHYDRCLKVLTKTIEEHFNIHHVTLQLEESNCEKSC